MRFWPLLTPFPITQNGCMATLVMGTIMIQWENTSKRQRYIYHEYYLLPDCLLSSVWVEGGLSPFVDRPNHAALQIQASWKPTRRGYRWCQSYGYDTMPYNALRGEIIWGDLLRKFQLVEWCSKIAAGSKQPAQATRNLPTKPQRLQDPAL